MAIFKCKMCGGDLDINEKMTVGTCQYCGSTMTLPKDTDDRKANLFNRANHFRRNNDFDKAITVYENILNEDSSNAEAHWGVVLCKYGIEYVEDPKTNERVPTCHRTQFDSILIDPDYKQAIANADLSARALYEAEARKIDAIQKQILEISAKEEPFDVFICYKETEETGSRTKASVLAQDIYYHLVEAGFKVFFSRITLEDKLGTAYEPYIFAALNSSKVMVVVGTKQEQFTSTWTKNEWSRYLALIKKGAKKVLIPAYRDMDPYDLPEEFSHLQAQDMGKIGFVQDLVRGIRKVVGQGEEKPAAVPVAVQTASSSIQSLLDRAFICLEDGDFNKADELLEQVLNADPRSAQAYVGKLMVELKISHEQNLANHTAPLGASSNYQKAVRFADEAYAKTIQGYNQMIKNRLEVERREKIYQAAVKTKAAAKDEYELTAAGGLFRQISGYKDADALAAACMNLAIAARQKAEQIAEEKRIQEERRIEELRIRGEQRRLEAERQAEIKRIENEKRRKRNRRIIMIGTPVAVVIIALIVLLNTVIIQYKYLILAQSKPGDIVKIGRYEQDNDPANGKEAIAWRVLAIENGKALLISEKNLDCQPYNTEYRSVTWATCTLRGWLNTTFINEAFPAEDQTRIMETELTNDDNPEYGTDGGNATRDKIFLLSIAEANQYFADDAARVAANTPYAVAKGAYDDAGKGWWWLRSPGLSGNSAARVHGYGYVLESGFNVDLDHEAVRPALWVNLQS